MGSKTNGTARHHCERRYRARARGQTAQHRGGQALGTGRATPTPPSNSTSGAVSCDAPSRSRGGGGRRVQSGGVPGRGLPLMPVAGTRKIIRFPDPAPPATPPPSRAKVASFDAIGGIPILVVAPALIAEPIDGVAGTPSGHAVFLLMEPVSRFSRKHRVGSREVRFTQQGSTHPRTAMGRFEPMKMSQSGPEQTATPDFANSA